MSAAPPICQRVTTAAPRIYNGKISKCSYDTLPLLVIRERRSGAEERRGRRYNVDKNFSNVVSRSFLTSVDETFFSLPDFFSNFSRSSTFEIVYFFGNIFIIRDLSLRT